MESERVGVSDRLSGCSGISSAQRHMIQRSEVIPTDEYRVSSPSQKKGSCFHSQALESLFQESTLPARDCKPVSSRRVTSTNITLVFLNSFIGLPKKPCRDAISHSSACNHRAAGETRHMGKSDRDALYIRDVEDYRLKCVKVNCCVCVDASVLNEPSHYKQHDDNISASSATPVRAAVA